MADFTTTPPVSIPLSVSAFLRLFGAGGVSPSAVFASDSGEARYTFVAPFPGVLVALPGGVAEASLQADIDQDQSVSKANWPNYSPIPKGQTVTVRVNSSYVGDPLNDLVDFVGSPESMLLTVGSPTSAAPIPISLTPTPATAGYFGASAIVITDGNGVTANLIIEPAPTNPDTYAFAAGGYKYLALPASMAALSVFKDNATNFPVPLAASADGFDQLANGLSFRLVTISGAAYRLYRTANILGGSITIYVS